MENIFKEGTEQEQVIVHLLNDNIRLQGEVLSLRTLLEQLFLKVDPNFDLAKAQLMQDAAAESFAQKVIEAHPLYSDYMKRQLKGLKGLGADFLN